MHTFFTKAKPQVEGFNNLPFLLDVVRWYFQYKNDSSPHAVTYAAYYTEQYAKNFDGAVDFDQSTEVELVSYHGDHKTWELAPEDIVSEFFRHRKGVKPDDAADALAQQYFVSLREQLSDYAVMMYRDRTTEEVIIVTGLKAAQALRDEKVKSFVYGPHQGHSYSSDVKKVTYAK